MMTTKFVNTIQALAYHVKTSDENQNINQDYATIIMWAAKFVQQFDSRLQKSGKVWTLKRYKSIYN
jgi:transposase-like protein